MSTTKMLIFLLKLEVNQVYLYYYIILSYCTYGLLLMWTNDERIDYPEQQCNQLFVNGSIDLLWPESVLLSSILLLFLIKYHSETSRNIKRDGKKQAKNTNATFFLSKFSDTVWQTVQICTSVHCTDCNELDDFYNVETIIFHYID